MRFLSILRTASPTANTLALASFLTLSIKIAALNKIHEIFPGAHEVGLVFESILASIFASYVFYIIVVHIKEDKDRKTVNPYIKKHGERLVEWCKAQLSSISIASNTPLALDTLKKESLKSAMTVINPLSDAPLSFTNNTYANWYQYFHFYSQKSQQSTRRILDQLPFLDARAVALTTEIDDCNHFSSIKLSNEIRLKNEDLSAFNDSFYEYCTSCKNLDKYLKTL
jgi:hypothetical protein